MVIQEIKTKVRAMLDERKELSSSEERLFSPSRYWQNVCAYFDYVFHLPDEFFAKLRLHTYHLTLDNYQTYFFGDPDYFKAVWRWNSLVQDLPPHLILSEPEGGIGFSFGNGHQLVSNDIVRFQKVIHTFYRHGVLSELSKNGRNFILEIGGGYGGLAYHLSRIFPNTTYVLIDLPETLLFSATYLHQHHPDKKIYLYDKTDFAEMLDPAEASNYAFILLPNYRLSSLNHFMFDLVINIASFQEMRYEQAEAYLDFIQTHCKGLLFTSNADPHPINKELSGLWELLKSRFKITKVLPPLNERIAHWTRETIKSMAVKTLTSHFKKKDSYKPGGDYLCRPLPKN